MKSKKTALMGLMTALAMIFSYIEFLIPISIGIPGIKLGLANIVTVVALYILKPHEAFLINLVRIMLCGLLFGNSMSLIYSLSGGILSFVIMLLLKKINGFSVYGVSIAGGVTHNIGQILAAMAVLENVMIAYYLPVLLIAGAATGFLMGFLSSRIIPQARKIFRQ
jgi:heptaprenyl diphosphate synthase